MKKIFYSLTLFLVLFFVVDLIAINQASAATMSFKTTTSKIVVEQQFRVDVLLNTQNEDINAVEGKIFYPSDLLEVKEISDGNSVVSLWVEKPKKVSVDQIVFSGITPGGLNNRKGLIFSIIFSAKQAGKGSVSFKESRALLSDGRGTAAQLLSYDFLFSISKQSSTSPVALVESTKDLDPPEDFTPLVSRSRGVLSNDWFLVFSTQDKGSGIDHFEVKEGKKPYVTTESPYRLRNQSLDEPIFVKAVDRNGNEKISILPQQRPSAWYKNSTVIAILLLIIAYCIRKILWRDHEE